MVLGIAYSADVPLLRWKRFPVLAATCILAVRAVIVQLGFFSHARLTLAKEGGVGVAQWVPPEGRSLGLFFGTKFMVLFSVAIALFKDLPDIAGDKKAGIRTLSVVLGQKVVFGVCVGLLAAAYAAATAVGATCCTWWWSKAVTMGSHLGLGVLLLARSRKVDIDSADSLYAFYMFIWKLFYAEYMLLPFIR